ncbi:AraC family transcriptional regulator [Lewinella sp. 4G2]|uniref:helix-turn-helix domain-containing protein n=1 Tax=Lewinella sp. 4G2 TaxID=1803372 RepID=UPI0007B47F20|nr:AraC family transcriptional regulator [Lewinella sp. 4G2]OAV45149.1 hypothetical protein A3850_011895 [Lewinella sp. 4G2]
METVTIDISRALREQFIDHFAGVATEEGFLLHNHLVTGTLQDLSFGGKATVLSFKYGIEQAFIFSSVNPVNSESILLNVNLSASEMAKEINGETVVSSVRNDSAMVYYPENTKVRHRLNRGERGENIIIQLHADFLKTFFSEHEIARYLRASSYYSLWLSVHQEQLIRQLFIVENKLQSFTKLSAFLETFFKALDKRIDGLAALKVSDDDVARIRISLETHAANGKLFTVKVSELAKAAGMSTTKFNHAFRLLYDRSPKQFLMKVKMDLALEKLKNGTDSIANLSYEIGYADPTKFTRAFKKYFGYAPNKIKNQKGK